MNSTDRTPVTVLTGFLGAGKTTLVNHVLTAEHGQRIAVIENEFGDIPIDNGLVVNTEEEIFEMSNGCCLCCTARTDLIDILGTLRQRGPVDRVLIETSGMADPDPVAQTFFVDDEVAAHYALDAVVTLVDAKHVGAHLDTGTADGVGHQVVDQIAFADRLVVNKTDLVDDEHVTSLKTRLRSINATAEILTSSHAEIDLTAVIGVGAFDLSHTMAVDPGWLDEREHHHDPDVTSVSVRCEQPLDREVFEKWLAALVERRGDDLYRLKGILAVDGHPRRFVLQGIHRMFELQPASAWGTDARESTVVFIGRDLDQATLTRELHACTVPQPEVRTPSPR